MDYAGQVLAQPVLLICCGLLAIALLLKCGERKGRLPHLIFGSPYDVVAKRGAIFSLQ
jgi:hypothetical protein